MKASYFIICENPKHSLKLLNNLDIKKKLISLHDHNEKAVIETIRRDLLTKIIVLISDAGSPLISDPGYNLIKNCIENNIKITSIPGPSSIIPAIQLSGLPSNQFNFKGFLPKTKKHIEDFIKIISDSDQTSVFFVSNHRILICLKIMDILLVERKISVAKELTKINENVFRGTSKIVADKMLENEENFKGEFVVVVEGNAKKNSENINLNIYKDEAKKLLLKFSLTDVVEIVHKLTGITKNRLYKWVLEIKKS